MGAEFHWNPNAEKEILKQAHDQIYQRLLNSVRHLRCSEHGQAPRITKAASPEEGWRIGPQCCDAFQAEVQRAVKI